MSLAISGDTIAYLMGLGLSGEQMKGLIDHLQRDAIALAPPATSSGINEERERLRNESTYAERKRKKDRDRQARIRAEARQSRDIDGDPATNRATSTATEGDKPATPPLPETKVSPGPLSKTQPSIPSKNPPNGGQKGSRLPDDWRPDGAGLAYAAEVLGPLIDPERELDRFLDYWRGVPGAKGRKLDWPATWRNWCRTAADRLPQTRKAHEPSHPDAKLAARQANYARAWAGAERAAGRADWKP